MRALVVGAGALGSWVGGALAAGGAEVTLVGRRPHIDVIAADGLVLRRAGRVRRVYASVVPRTAAARGRFDIGLVAVKSYHTATVADELVALATPPARVVSLQNGIGNEPLLAAALPDSAVVAGTVTTAVTRPSPGVVEAGPRGGVGLAPPSDVPIDDLLGALRAGGLSAERYADGPSMLWSKVLLNMLGGATCGVLDWPPRRVFADRRLFALEHAAWREALAVMAALGTRPLTLPGYPVGWFATAVRWLPARWLYPLVRRRLMTARGARLPGVAADLRAGRTQSEVTVLNGAVAEHGAALGVPTPVNRTLTALVVALAEGRADRTDYADHPEALIEAVAGARARAGIE